MYSTSLFGREETFSRSRYDDSGLIPGMLDLACSDVFGCVVVGIDVGCAVGGGGGGCWKGEYFVSEGPAAACPCTVAAERRKSAILSLYASFNDDTESCPSLRVFEMH